MCDISSYLLFDDIISLRYMTYAWALKILNTTNIIKKLIVHR